jgi:MFS family permease
MILFTYGVSGLLLALSGFLFDQGALTATTQTIFWGVIFFLASAGASSAYLTVSEIFPLELRAETIALFFAISQLAGGVAAPTLFAALIGNGTSRGPLTIGYYLGAAVMMAGGVIAWFFGVNAERLALEDIATPLSAVSRAVGETSSAPAT